jgi:hypothetical protein
VSKIWLNSDGQIILDDDGKVAVCDDCPCGCDCSAYATTYQCEVADSSFFTITLSDTAICTINPALNPYCCYWNGSVPNGVWGGDTCTLWVETTLGVPNNNWHLYIFRGGCGIDVASAKIDPSAQPNALGGAYTGGSTVV